DYRYYSLIATNIAVLQITNKSFTQAIKTLKEAEQTLLKNKQPEFLPTVYNSLGAAYQSVAPDSCLFYYQKSLDIASLQKDYLNMMTAYQNIGDFYLEQKNFPGAIEYMKKAIAINELRPEDQYKPALYDRISVLYETAGDLKNAFKYKKLETEVRQKLFSAEKQKEIDELEIKYQTEKKENEIQLNRQEIAEGKHQRNLVLFGALLLFIIAGFITYLLFQRRKITQQFEQEKLKLFENIFHEIRTPLTMIDGPIQMMKQQPENLNTEQLVLMERNSKKLTRLVNELLDASKLGKGSFQLQYAIGNISDFIEDIITGYRAEAGSAEINIVSDINIEDGMYSFPSNAVEKIVANLLGNAIKYCPAQSQIDIRAKVEGEMLTFEIKDNGHGIPKTEQK
ncbi:MAG: sensor histidine kinase, partial [Flavobacterium sp.]